jgi:hypothetical protein
VGTEKNIASRDDEVTRKYQIETVVVVSCLKPGVSHYRLPLSLLGKWDVAMNQAGAENQQFLF